MNINDSKVIMDRLNNLMTAAESFGSQSEQLEKVRNDFDGYLANVEKTNQQMMEVINKCNEYIDSARAIVEKDLSEQVKEIVDSTEKTVASCKDHCEKVSLEYANTITLFEQQKAVFDNQQNEMMNAVNSGFESEVDTIKVAVQSLTEKTCDATREILAESDSKYKTIFAELTNLKENFETIKERQLKLDLYLKIGTGAAVIAAISAIIGLFI